MNTAEAARGGRRRLWGSQCSLEQHPCEPSTSTQLPEPAGQDSLPITGPAEIAAGVRELSVWGQGARIPPAAALAVTAMELDRQGEAGQELGGIGAAHRQVSGGLGW